MWWNRPALDLFVTVVEAKRLMDETVAHASQ